MPSFQDSAVLVILALLLFGPKKLPVLARQLGKLMADFRRASNEFRAQMEEELRIAEQADRQKQIAAIEAAAPSTPVAESTPEQPHLPPPAPNFATPSDSESDSPYAQDYSGDAPVEISSEPSTEPAAQPTAESAPQPIATSGELSIMPPSTGLPLANSAPAHTPAAAIPAQEDELETETLHG